MSLLGVLIIAVACKPPPPSVNLTIEQVLPVGAVKAEIDPRDGSNSVTPDGHYLWVQGFNCAGSFDQVINEVQQRVASAGYTLEDHTHYRDTFGETGVPNSQILRIFRGRGRSLGLYCLRDIASRQGHAEFVLMFRDY
jgi:hypothetical protein